VNEIISQLFQGLGQICQDIELWLSPVLPGGDWTALLAFILYTLFILAGGLTAVLARNLIRAMMGLVVTFLGVAGMYLLLASPFLAFMQLLIYIGAVCVLIFFAIMLTKNTADGQEAKLPPAGNIILAILAALGPLAVVGPLLYQGTLKITTRTPVDSTANLGEGLLSIDLIPFELISVILLVAMAGAVYLAWSKPKGVIS
jgi:NADH-quinone oxidoreductase subunit J